MSRSYSVSWLVVLQSTTVAHQPRDSLGSSAYLMPHLLFRMLCYIMMSIYLNEKIFFILILIFILDVILSCKYRKDSDRYVQCWLFWVLNMNSIK